MKTPILGSAYVARSVNAADNRMVNLFPEIVPEAGKEPAFLNRAPGLTLLATVGNGPIRGVWAFGGNLYVVSGGSLYKVDTSYNATLLGAVDATGNVPVSMTDNGTQLIVVAGGPGYIYTPGTGVFAAIADPDYPGAGLTGQAMSVGFLDGYFVVNKPGTQRVYCSNLYDGTSWDPTNFASAEGFPDNVVGLIVNHRELWVFGESSTEVWFNAGNAGFPFGPIQGAFNEIGCVSAYTIAKLDNTVFWLNNDARGQGIVYKARGYSGERVSTHAVEWHIQSYENISNAIAYTYQQDGHAFYVLVFPSANTTWVYDVATSAWHERAAFSGGNFTRHRGNCQVFYNNVNIVGDYDNGNLYKFDLTNYTDNNAIQKWLRSWRAMPTGQNNLKRTAHHSLQLDCETGVGLNSGQGSNPQVMLRWSDDGGHTWSNEHWTSLGAIGDFGNRAIWRRLGMTLKIRDRVYEVSGTDPVKIAITGAELIMSPTNA